MESKQDSVDSAVLPDDSGHAATAPARTRARGTIRTRLYRDGELIKEDFPPDEISEELTQRHGCIIWLDLCEPTLEQLDIIGREFGLHQLAIEDALEETQRTKIDRYRTHLFMAAYSATLDESTGELVTQRDCGVHHPPCPHHGPQLPGLRHRSGGGPLGQLAGPGPVRRVVLAVRAAGLPRRRALSGRRVAGPGHRGDRGRALRYPPGRHRAGPAPVVPAAQEPGGAAAHHPADPGGGQHPASP